MATCEAGTIVLISKGETGSQSNVREEDALLLTSENPEEKKRLNRREKTSTGTKALVWGAAPAPGGWSESCPDPLPGWEMGWYLLALLLSPEPKDLQNLRGAPPAIRWRYCSKERKLEEEADQFCPHASLQKKSLAS